MQMESWRERGFVPDSDEEDGFDSLDLKKTNAGNDSHDDELDYITVPSSTPANAKDAVKGPRPETGSITLSDIEETLQGTEEKEKGVSYSVASSTAEDGQAEKQTTQSSDTVDGERDHSRDAFDDDETPKPRTARKKYGKRSSSTKFTNLHTPQSRNTPEKQARSIWDFPSSPPQGDERLLDSPSLGSAPNHTNPEQLARLQSPQRPQTPRAKPPRDVWSVQSSSDDELALDTRPAPKALQRSILAVEVRNMPQQKDSDDESPLSSPPSNVGSEPDANDSGEKQTAAATPPHQDADPMDGLSPQDVHGDLLGSPELAPAQRRFRERKFNQLHPYLWEDAHYQKQMKDGGYRPVRAPRPLQQPQQTTDESQEQDSYNPNQFQSSPVREENLPPPRSARHKLSPHRQAHVVKRRKISHVGSADNPHRSHAELEARGAIDSTTAQSRRISLSIWDISPSPPRSGDTSPAARTSRAPEGFRFPLGFSPPAATASPKQQEPRPQEAEDTNRAASLGPNGNDVEALSSSSSQQGSDDESEPGDSEERLVHRLQRKTRGVLPASYHRIELKNQEKNQMHTWRDRPAASQRADAKGVARKVTRKPSLSGPSSPPRQNAFFDLEDSEDDDSAGVQNAHENRSSPPNQDESQRMADLGLADSFRQDGDDIPEDNRIDYMFAPVSRGPTGPRKKGSLKRQKSKEIANLDERQRKKARLKRQTRLTDASYGGRRAKQSSSSKVSVPRLGILDAPDVATRPPKEQPQFLRVAARRVRSRRDGGRRSPTRKFLKLGSKDDTTDANESLREWRRGAIRQSKISLPQPRPRKRQPLVDLSSSGPRAITNVQNTRIPSHFAATDPDTVLPDDAPEPPEQAPRADGPVPDVASNENKGPGQPAQPEKRGIQWVARRNVAISSLKRNNARPAAISLAGPAVSRQVSPAEFRQSLSLLNRDFRSRRTSRTYRPSLTLDRYLSDSGSASAATKTTPKPVPVRNTVSQSQPRPVRRRGRKQTPRHINLDSGEFHQNQDPITVDSDDSNPPTVPHKAHARSSASSIGGLFNWKRSYLIDFGITPLRDGTFFHESTFIGSGEFSRSLEVLKRDLDRDAGSISIEAGERSFQWGVWNDTVSSELGHAFDVIIENVEQSAVTSPEMGPGPSLTSASIVYRSLIKYVTKALQFIDPVDRTGFVSRAIGLVCKLKDPLVAFVTGSEYNTKGLVKIAAYNLVFANQIHQVASHSLVSPVLAGEALDLTKTSAKDVAAFISREACLAEIRRLIEDNKKAEWREMGLREDYPSAEAYVITKQLLHGSEHFKGYFEELQFEACASGITSDQKNVSDLELGWQGLFTFLPLNEINPLGIARSGSRFQDGHENWNLIKQFLSPVLDYFETNSATQPISYNTYCRALFHRCHRIINAWGWRDCKPILDTLYDFFAKNTVYNLRLEESRGSPSFLDELDGNPSLDAQPGEPCFHTLLKIIASGLRFLAQQYNERKIRNFAWRLLPNHGKMYPKEKPLRHEDLDALRNHHDLLCTLYWAVPDGCRPRVEAIRDLVHPAISHRETCSISLRSWMRLVRFKLSTNEDISGLDPFADWYGYFVMELRQQHSYARKEIEAQSKNDSRISQQLIESTISQNQRPFESLLSAALDGMQAAVKQAPSLEHAHRLVSKTPFDSIIGLFNPKLARVNVVVSKGLQVMLAYAHKDASAEPASAAPAFAAVDEDSQEFGDWSAIEAVLGQQESPSEEIEYVKKVFHPIVSRLVSNCFGEDHCPEDAILLNVVDCWTSIAQVLVRHGLRHWDNYLSEHGDESWERLRKTIQTRKFAPQFLVACIEKDTQTLSDCRIQVMRMWMSSLVERSSMLKFQHRLTAVLLNKASSDPLLVNIPFSKDKADHQYSISLEELSARRLSLLSSLLSNMREHLQHLELAGSRDFSVTKQEYSELLQLLMAAMKSNYRELGNGATESAQGAYVDFVHRVIGFLQQHTSDIRPIDPFFTDPASFPLPSSDPRYIVAKLKRYEPKLTSSKEVQTLTIFIQSISERAAIDGQQGYLVDQLHTSMKDTYEAGDPERPTLRATLLQCVFPAYLESTFRNRAAWILGRPVIQTIALEFKDLMLNLNTTDPACVSSLVRIFGAVFESSFRALHPLSTRPNRLNDPTVLSMLAAFLDMASSALVVIDYINRIAGAECLIAQVQWLHQFTVAISDHLPSHNVPTTAHPVTAMIQLAEPPTSTAPSTHAPFIIQARCLALEDLQSYLRRWSFHEGRYYFTRPGHESQEISVEPEIASVIDSRAKALCAFKEAASRFTERTTKLQLVPL
ncbi:hypothetical protein NUU61_003144 [Penicillium alfredii]|uniref:Protein mms22 n=1 Tax=Penicillium alfredii TaxID=1506179 RepID=A0A9W9KHW4_9EURO|nr:uncharacterized protein NUU61_003144 [Penicillium alfredii]KAJ5105797.1 hypothetical protein NUU61_003144 [Penicillium alfredii]